MSALPEIAGRDLPSLAYSHDASHDVRLMQTEHFRPVVGAGGVKPGHGGLWTAPVTVAMSEGAPECTSWLEWCRGEEFCLDYYTHLTVVTPAPDARVLRVDNIHDLSALVRAFPASHDYPSASTYPDWPGLAAAGWDAVYLTDAGQWATRMTHPLSLYGWDCATVLWLRPAYTVGATVAVSLVGAS